MAHDRLFPKSGGSFLPPNEAVARLAAEFPGLQADGERANVHVRQMVQQLRRMSHLTPPPASEEEIARLEQAATDSIYVVMTDEEGEGSAALTTCIIPNTPLFFGYSSHEDEITTRPLLLRCARSLEYQIENEESDAAK